MIGIEEKPAPLPVPQPTLGVGTSAFIPTKSPVMTRVRSLYRDESVPTPGCLNQAKRVDYTARSSRSARCQLSVSLPPEPEQ